MHPSRATHAALSHECKTTAVEARRCPPLPAVARGFCGAGFVDLHLAHAGFVGLENAGFVALAHAGFVGLAHAGFVGLAHSVACLLSREKNDASWKLSPSASPRSLRRECLCVCA